MPGSRFLLDGSPGGTARFLGRGYEAEKLVHFRGFRENLRPHQRRAEKIAKGSQQTKSGHQYIGSVPRIVIHDWLQKQGKTWEDWGRDRELKAKFMLFFQSEYKQMMAANYCERSLSINRSLSGRTATAPKLGARILENYRKEIAA